MGVQVPLRAPNKTKEILENQTSRRKHLALTMVILRVILGVTGDSWHERSSRKNQRCGEYGNGFLEAACFG